MGLGNRLQHAWNAFVNNRDPTSGYRAINTMYSRRPDRVRFTGGNDRTIVTSVYTRIAIDAAAVDITHARLDDNKRYVEDVDSGLNYCITTEANIDQSSRAFFQDVYMSMFDEGCVAIVPVETTLNPHNTGSYDILSLRTGKVVEWRPDSVKIRLYNERTGTKDHVWMKKRNVAIVENPLYAIVNERNSIMQRLIRKLSLLDAIDEQSSAGKLDMIIQLPYVIRNETMRKRAEDRRKDIELQLNNSKYGIAYTDGTERITQLNRPLENNLMKQIEFLTSMLFSQLGITQTIMDGTADEATMLNYYNRTIEPIVNAVVDEMKRKFLTKTARTKGQSIVCFRDPFSLVPINDIAKIADTFTRNEILTSNEIRQIIGMKPASDPKADQLINSNLNHPGDPSMMEESMPEDYAQEGEIQNGSSEQY